MDIDLWSAVVGAVIGYFVGIIGLRSRMGHTAAMTETEEG